MLTKTLSFLKWFLENCSSEMSEGSYELELISKKTRHEVKPFHPMMKRLALSFVDILNGTNENIINSIIETVFNTLSKFENDAVKSTGINDRKYLWSEIWRWIENKYRDTLIYEQLQVKYNKFVDAYCEQFMYDPCVDNNKIRKDVVYALSYPSRRKIIKW